MKTLILGGTGMLGYPAALEAVKAGHQVEATARHAAKMGTPFDDHVKLHLVDMFELTGDELTALMRGVDNLIYALGPDDRIKPPPPAYGYFERHLIRQTERILKAARSAGVRRAVVLNSYFATMDRLHPEWELAAHHPYVQARIKQAARAVAAGEAPTGEAQMDVMILEIPYVFGITPQRESFWKAVLFDIVRARDTAYCASGSTMAATTEQVGQACIGAALRGEHGQRYPIGDSLVKFDEMNRIIIEAMGQQKPVVVIPVEHMQPAMEARHNAEIAAGQEGGLDARRLAPDVLYRDFYFDPEPSRQALGFGRGGLEQALRDTVKSCYSTGD